MDDQQINFPIQNSMMSEEIQDIPDEELSQSFEKGHLQNNPLFQVIIPTHHRNMKSYPPPDFKSWSHSNPLLQNKGYIKDDWQFIPKHQKQSTEQYDDQRRVKKQGYLTINQDKLSVNNLNAQKRLIVPKESGKNTLVSTFLLNQSTNNICGPQSRQAVLKECPSFVKQSNARLTFNNLNENSFDLNHKDVMLMRDSSFNQSCLNNNLHQRNKHNQQNNNNIDFEEEKQHLNQQPARSLLDLPDRVLSRNKLSNFLQKMQGKQKSVEYHIKDESQRLVQYVSGFLFDDNNVIKENVIQENIEELDSSLMESDFRKSHTSSLSHIKNTSSLIGKLPYQRLMTSGVLTLKCQELCNNIFSKSYVYLPNGLSQNFHHHYNNLLEEQPSGFMGVLSGSKITVINYASLFFQSDSAVEQYKDSLKEALVVQFQKEINISHNEIKTEYDNWIGKFQKFFKKKSHHKKTLVFDLDETLVRAQEKEPEGGYDSRIKVVDPDREDFYVKINTFNHFQIYVKFRPGLKESLELLKEHFELILFTASSDSYADIVLSTFDGASYFDHILSRKQCLFIEQYLVYVKDLSILTQGRNLKDILIVDNKVQSYSSNLSNGIPIRSYLGDPNDNLLPCLVTYLLQMLDVEDVRPEILKDFCLEEIQEVQRRSMDLFQGEEIKKMVLKEKDKKIQQKILQQRQNVSQINDQNIASI